MDKKNPFRQFTTISVTITTGEIQFNLGQFQRLSNARLYSVRFPYNTALVQGPTGKATVSAALLFNGFLTLQTAGGTNIVEDDPIYNYIPNVDIKPERRFDGVLIDWTKSFVKFLTAADVTANNAKVVLCVVEYEMPTDSVDGQVFTGNKV